METKTKTIKQLEKIERYIKSNLNIENTYINIFNYTPCYDTPFIEIYKNYNLIDIEIKNSNGRYILKVSMTLGEDDTITVYTNKLITLLELINNFVLRGKENEKKYN